jgi:transcriptional regulator with XRE-family HTH domain
MSKSPATPVGKAIRKIRKSKGLTQGHLGEMVGMKDTAIQRIEVSSTSNPNLSTLQRLAWALGVTVAELVADVPVIMPNPSE